MDVALSVAQWVVGQALAPIADGVLEAWAASKNLGANVEALKMELLYVKATLENASKKQLDGHPALEELLQKMRDSAQKAENVLDMLDYYRIHDELNSTFNTADENPKGQGHDLVQTARHTAKAFGKLGNLFPCSCLPNIHGKKQSLQFRRVEVSNSMKQIVDDLQPLRKEISSNLLGCSPSVAVDIARNRPITTHEIIEPQLYGRDVTVNSIINDITKGEYRAKDLTVLPIVGVGGIGKTTMTQHIYHNKEVQTHFDVVIWVCVSLHFDPIKLLSEIKEKIPEVKGEKVGTTGEVIAQRLTSKKFLLIMDDMWECSNKDDWKRFLLPFKNPQKNGSIIMVTTRLPELAQMIKTTDRSIELGGLEPIEFRKLFLAFVFGDEQCRMDQMLLLEIGDKIITKLKGSPLAAKTVGSLLRKDLDSRHWTKVLESKEWETQTADHDIMPALKLSYDYLPFPLQQCFSYCALYPEDYMFTNKELIHFWIGLDILISGSRNTTSEYIGQSNLNDLVAHGFFRKEEIDGHPRYVIHDLLHDLASKVVDHDCLSLHRSNAKSAQFLPSTRHLSIIIDSGGDSDGVTQENFKRELMKLKTIPNVENLRTLLIFGEVDETFGHIFCNLFEKANDLRVLRLITNSYPVESIFHNFSTFLHLRYLLLGTWHYSQMHLPSAISRFYHLRILDIERWDGSINFTTHISNLTKLRHFNTKHNEYHSTISNVGKLQFLQELNKFIVNREDNGFELNQLDHLGDLTELGIYNLERVQTKETAAEARLIDKVHLDNLILQWESNNEPDIETMVLESLRPHNNLQNLCIGGHRGPSCPTWLGSKLSVKALKSLQLYDVAWENLPSLGQMWVLDYLSLRCIPTLNELGPNHFGLITEQSFCNLKKLALIRLEKLEKWVGREASQLFSGLQELTITECPELLELPFVNNMHFLPNLKVFNIVRCPKLTLLPPIPWTHTLCDINIHNVGFLDNLAYSKSSSAVELKIRGVSNESRVEVMIFVSSNLKELQGLVMSNSPPLVMVDFKMLTSLKKLTVERCKIVIGAMGDLGWKVHIENLQIWSCDVSGKVLTHLLCGLTRLRELTIYACEKITLLDMVVEKQHMTTTLPSSSADEIEDTQATYLHQHIAIEEDETGGDDGLLLLPSHFADCLQKLAINFCGDLTLIAPTTLPNGDQRGGNRGGGLQALRSLQKLDTSVCPKFLSASSYSCCPLPSSLQELDLGPYCHMEMLECLSNLTSLTKLKVGGNNLRSAGLWHLITVGQLSELYIKESPNFFVDWFPHQDEQEQLLLSRSSKLHKLMTEEIEGVLHVPVCRVLSFSLTILQLSFCREMDGFTKEQAEALHLLTSLQELEFRWCDKLRSLPEGLNKLTSLRKLCITTCPAIRCLPKDVLPGSLQLLDVSHCDNHELKEQCRKLKGTIPQIKT